MRVISGKARGTKLAPLKGAPLRPTLDRVKESLFNRIGPLLEGENLLDLFAGSGNIGIEALSRHAQHVVFVENHVQSQKLIVANLEKCRFDLDASNKKLWELMKTDALSALKTLQLKGQQFDWIYIDPPFDAGLYDIVLEFISNANLLKSAGQVVVERHSRSSLQIKYGRLELNFQRRMGDSTLCYFSF
jgi:16S rRNA (guanine(966)-N(2))-methyltransferase RsmD